MTEGAEHTTLSAMTSLGPRSGADEKLADIQSLTDTALSRLDAPDLLAELLERAKAILQADTAALLLLDRATGELVANAASGIEDEVRQGVRIPLGRGFAGRIAAERRPVILDHVDHTTVLNPILLAKGIRSLLGVPLIAEGTVLGVLHVGSVGSRTFTSEDADLLQLAADRAAVALQSAMSRSDREAARALRRGLAPSALPVVPGMAMAARYVPGRADVGGDWYDVFVLPSGQLAVTIGDVAGSGLKAAVIMGRIRSALRAYALETTDPADVLGRVDRKMQHFEPNVLATMLYAVFDPALDSARISSAGHLSPVIAAPGQHAVLADIQADLLIGVSPDAERQSATVPIEPGTLLCFYTDGLVERRDEAIDTMLEKLCKTVEPGPPDGACAAIMASLIGHESASDDVTLLVLRRQPTSSGG
jgi:sigma-B regulation protein RsbU (phosphoserine phosphatase)